MKTFFLALILGIFVGLFINNYFADPAAYSKLKEAKNSLFETAEPETPSPAKPETELPSEQPEPALFEVASKELKTDTPPPASAQTIEPQPFQKPETATETPPTPQTEAPSDPTNEPLNSIEPPPPPAEEPSIAQKAETFVEQSAEKAAEIADTVKEKVKEAAEDAKPQIEEKIDTGIDTTIALAIRGQYKLEKRIESDQIQVTVSDRIVTLSGSMPDEASKQLAIEIAVFTKGVNGVEESLTIRPAATAQ